MSVPKGARFRARSVDTATSSNAVRRECRLAGPLARAHTVSWAVTFLFMALAVRLDNLLAGLTGFALVYIAVAIMTATFGICFLWLARDPGASDPEVPRA